MGLEIERKYLVNKDKWAMIRKDAGRLIWQGYIMNDPGKTIRVRLAGQNAHLTIKSLPLGISRLEFEYQIPKEDAEELLKTFSVSEIKKIRYALAYKGKVWDVDEFLDENTGLVLAEIELNDTSEDFEIPDWIGEEVTGDERYYNSRLSTQPFGSWDH
jgi:adenylate cyclase